VKRAAAREGVERYRGRMRAAGFRLVQLWVPDARAPRFPGECHRQSRAVEPSARNGLRALSQVMVDKLTTVRRERIGAAIRELEPDSMTRVNRALALWLGIAG
jgi:hypothetical protein